MPKHQPHSKKQASSNTVCARCEHQHPNIRRFCLTGTGDHPRSFYLCPDCWGVIVEKWGSSQSPENPVMTETVMRHETRLQKALDRLGTDHPVCACCPETNPFCMELHHLEGKDFGETLLIICRNCHRKLSEAQKDHPVRLGTPPMTLETIGHFLLGLADLFLLLVSKLSEFGEYLIEQARTQQRMATP